MIYLFVITWALSSIAFISFDYYTNNELSIVGEAAADVRAASKSAIRGAIAAAEFLFGLVALGGVTYVLLKLAAAII